MTVIAAQTAIPTNFGEGGANLVPGGAQGKPDLVTILTEHKVAIAALDASIVNKRTVAIDFTQFAALANGVKTFDALVGAALPANARLVGAVVETFTGFDDPTHGAFTLVLGTSAGGNQIGTALNVAAGQLNFPKPFAAGAQGYVMAPQGAAQVQARLTGAADLNTVTAGHVVINFFYDLVP